MSKAYKCDRCGKLYEKGEIWINEKFTILDVEGKIPKDLCATCYRDLEEWLRKSTVEPALTSNNNCVKRSVYDCKYLLPCISGEHIMYYGFCSSKDTLCSELCDHAQFAHLDKKEVADERDNL